MSTTRVADIVRWMVRNQRELATQSKSEQTVTESSAGETRGPIEEYRRLSGIELEEDFDYTE